MSKGFTHTPERALAAKPQINGARLVCGFTLIETIIAVGIFSIISLGIYFSYSNVLDVIISSQANLAALSVADNEIEILQGMNYQDIVGGEKTVQQSGIPFTVKTFVQNIDDPFDGTGGSDPNPQDYKLVEVELSCASCARFTTRKITTQVAP